ncbi:hypothetical protein E2562_007477 [Oryza meyeriana var. granulata]|uniref:Uncharacterized protein n=1 Tax=Oryza meyeriana var. granulata TaxID=110450 RepID=A0A6G1F4Y9_9ORYZ|nr:hypothetical protein E2562_007477 [Oryza meyeriana var. granulata]
MAHDAKASGSSQPPDGETGLEACSMPREGDARSLPTRKKKKMTPTPERHPFVGSPWGFTGPKPK